MGFNSGFKGLKEMITITDHKICKRKKLGSKRLKSHEFLGLSTYHNSNGYLL